MPPKSVKKAQPSPKLKKKINVSPINNSTTKQNQYINWITSSNTAVDDFDVHYITKWQGVDKAHKPPQAAFINPMKIEFKEKGIIGSSNIKAIMPRRDPSQDGQVNFSGQEGTGYPWECLVTERSNDTDDASSMGKNIAMVFNEFGSKHPLFTIPPKFAFQKDLSSDPPKPLNYYVCDVQCFMLLKSVYSEDNSKEDVMANDDIMTAYFGSPDDGRVMLQNITEGVWRSTD